MYARQNNIDAIFTLDEDFYNILLEHGVPPKIIWLRIGNCSTSILANVINKNAETIHIFANDSSLDILEIFK
jgi:predicted nuclease of predicted toxin-antitoxin system